MEELTVSLRGVVRQMEDLDAAGAAEVVLGGVGVIEGVGAEGVVTYDQLELTEGHLHVLVLLLHTYAATVRETRT